MVLELSYPNKERLINNFTKYVQSLEPDKPVKGQLEITDNEIILTFRRSEIGSLEGLEHHD